MAEYIAGQHEQVLERVRQRGGFQGDSLRQISLDGQRLTGTRFAGVRIERCGMTGADLSRSRLDDTRISNTSLRQIEAQQSAWVEARLRLCDMVGARILRSTLNGCRFDETPMTGCDFEGSTLTGCEFDFCDLMHVSFKDAVLMRCRFRDARLGNANLLSGSFEGAQLVDVDLRDANLQYANFRGALLVRVHLQGANLEGADLEGATMVEVKGVGDDVLDRMRSRRQEESGIEQHTSRHGDLPAARPVDLELQDNLEHLSTATLLRLSRELLRTYVIEASGALLSEDPASALLRQRNLSFSDLMRFIKERFPHEEFNQLSIEGDQVYMRTQAGDVPLTRYTGGRAAGTGNAPPPTSRAAQGGSGPSGGGGAYALGSSSAGARNPARSSPSSAAMALGNPGLPPPTTSFEVRSREPADPGGVGSEIAPPLPPPSAPMDREDEGAFEPDRFGMIDL